jgi:hypothetical protein
LSLKVINLLSKASKSPKINGIFLDKKGITKNKNLLGYNNANR